jgi:hypothetical protein
MPVLLQLAARLQEDVGVRTAALKASGGHHTAVPDVPV